MDKARSIATSTWTLGAFVFLLTWGGGFAPAYTPNVDVSYQAGLTMAAYHGLDFGPDIAMTYGPLGFLKSYFAFYEWPTRIAALYGLTLHLALSVSLVWALRRNFPAVVAVAIALVAAVIMRGDLSAFVVRSDAGVVGLTLIWSIAAIAPRAPAYARPIVLYGGGVFAAIELLAKLNTGFIVLALVAIAAITMEGDRRRNLATLAGTLAGSLAVLWFATGHGLGDVGSFLSSSFQIISGYSSGARVEFGWEDRGYDYLLAPIMLIGAVAIAWIAGRGATTGRRVAMLASLGIVAFTAYKAGFVAHETWHMATFYGTMLATYIAFPLPDSFTVRASALAGTIAVAVATLIAVSYPGYPLSDPIENVENAATTALALVDGEELDDEIAENRSRLTSQFALDERSRELVEGHSVHVDPSETAVAWAHDFDWSPLPTFQPYAAWTPELDERNAEVLASSSGPDRVLRQSVDGFGRYPGWESPAAMVAMLCNFEPLNTTEEWQVLGRVPDRCGEPRSIGTAEGTFGEPIPIPPAPPGSAVFARFDGVQVSGLERLRAMIARPKARTYRFGGGPVGGPDARVWALAERTAGDGVLVSIPPELDFAAPFGLAPNPETITFFVDGETPDDPITAEFFALPVAKARAAEEA